MKGKKFERRGRGGGVGLGVRDVIEGWIMGMEEMCVGEKWEV